MTPAKHTPAVQPPQPPRLPRVVKAVRISTVLVPTQIQQRALVATAKYVELAGQLFNRRFPMPNVAFDLRGRTAGQAFWEQNLLRYNAVLLIENIADFETDTIPHEVAHLIARQVFGKKIASHGDEWKRVMRAFGVSPSRCHAYDVTNSAVGGLASYTCDCGKLFPLGPRRSKTARAGRLTCRACKGKLRPVGSAAGTTAAVRPTSPRPAPPTPVPARAPAPTQARPPAPVRRPTPPASSGASPRAATPAMLQFALTIAHQLGIALQPEHTASFEACSTFISQFKRSSPTGATSLKAPSEKQLQFARDLARRKGLLLGADVLCDSVKMSAWLTANR
jgi:SprT protein